MVLPTSISLDLSSLRCCSFTSMWSVCRNIRRNEIMNVQHTEEKEGESSDSNTAIAAQSDEKKPTVDYMDDVECKFNVNCYKMVYVIKSESYLYKRKALTRAREVSGLVAFLFMLFNYSILCKIRYPK